VASLALSDLQKPASPRAEYGEGLSPGKRDCLCQGSTSRPTPIKIFTMQRTALFVIDIQNELAGDLETQIPHASRVCSAGQRILDKARAKIDLVRLEGNQSPMVIVFVQHEEKPGDGSLVRGSRPWELVFRPREKDEDELLVAKTVGKSGNSDIIGNSY